MLIDQLARDLQMTREDALEQAICFAYANARMENPNITEVMVRRIALSVERTTPHHTTRKAVTDDAQRTTQSTVQAD